ncbi:MAG: hypothetical protein ACYCVB_12045 [Bacilli bacterium]
MRQRTVWALIACVLIFYLSAAALLTPAADSTPLPAGTSYSRLTNGTAALYSLFRGSPSAGSWRLLTEPQLGLPAHTTVFIVDPQTDDTASTAKVWIHFIRSGGRLVGLLNHSSALATALGLRVAPMPAAGGALRLTLLPAAHSRRAAATFGVSGAGPYATLTGNLRGGQRWLLTLPDRAPRTVGVTERIGQGSVTLLGLPGLAFNGAVAKSGNLGVLLTLLQPTRTRIAFVETVHGYSAEPGAAAVFGAGISGAFALLCAAAVIWLWGEGRRFGRPLASVRSAPSASLQLAQAMADHYRRAGNFNSLLTQLAQLARARDVPLTLPRRMKNPGPNTFIAECNVFIAALRSRRKSSTTKRP